VQKQAIQAKGGNGMASEMESLNQANKQVVKQVNKQANKQVTEVNVDIDVPLCDIKKPIRRRKVKKLHSRRSKKSCIVMDEICGQIKQKCNEEPVTYWQSKGLHPTGSIRVFNDSSCTMFVHVHLHSGDIIRKSVTPSQHVSFTATGLRSLVIKCKGDDDAVCTGNYVVRLHYRT
jgi:hypothetical protein